MKNILSIQIINIKYSKNIKYEEKKSVAVHVDISGCPTKLG